MKVFTIGTGEYSHLADITVTAFEWATGLRVERITQLCAEALSHGAEAAYAQKLLLPDEEQYLFFDADLLFLRKWQVPDVGQDEFAGVLAQRFERRLRSVIATYGGDPRHFVNTGLFVASSRHRPAMRQALEWMRDGVSVLHEESLLNCALQKLGTKLRPLPPSLNQQVITNMRAHGFHLCGQRGILAKLAEARYLVAHHAPPELRELLTTKLGT